MDAVETEALIRQIEERKTRRAQEASMAEKILDGPRLFRLCCQAIKAGLRLDHPTATEEELHAMLIARVYRR